MMRRWLPLTTLFATLMSSVPVVKLAAQQGSVTLRGTVQDSSTSRPVAGVAVLIDGSNLPQTTDSVGSFRLSGIESGGHALVFMKNGYTPLAFSVTVEHTESDEIDVGLLLLLPGPAPVANIVGTVTDSLTRLPLAAADVFINGERVASTDNDGVFRIPAVDLVWGSNLLGFRRVGYAPLDAELWTATEEADFNIEIDLMPLALRMPEVVVEGERTIFHFGPLREFTRRSRTGLGHYVTRQDIERMQPLIVTDVFELIPGVYVGSVAAGSPIRMLRGGGCVPSFFLDGLLLNPLRSVPLDFSINDILLPRDVEGIEVYKGAATIPLEFNTAGRGCGVIAIWTRTP